MAGQSGKGDRPRAWRPRPGGMPKPSLREAMQTGYVAQTADEASADELDRWERWRRATMQERAETLAGLLELVEVMGRFPPKQDRFPGWKTILAQRHAKTTVR